MEEMKAKGGQQAAMAEQMMARMNCKSGGGGGPAMFETNDRGERFLRERDSGIHIRRSAGI